MALGIRCSDRFGAAGLVTGNVTIGKNYTVGCAGGYKPANASKTTTVMCMVTGDADEWEGDTYWAVTAGAGCVATTCNASDITDLAATYINAVPAAKAGHYGCADAYCLRYANASGCLTSDHDLTFALECGKNDLVRITPRTEKVRQSRRCCCCCGPNLAFLLLLRVISGAFLSLIWPCTSMRRG